MVCRENVTKILEDDMHDFKCCKLLSKEMRGAFFYSKKIPVKKNVSWFYYSGNLKYLLRWVRLNVITNAFQRWSTKSFPAKSWKIWKAFIKIQFFHWRISIKYWPFPFFYRFLLLSSTSRVIESWPTLAHKQNRKLVKTRIYFHWFSIVSCF